MNPSADGLIPCPGTPTISLLVEKSRIRLAEIRHALRAFTLGIAKWRASPGPFRRAFPQLLGWGSFRTIDPVTTCRTH
jgi:hypothetical protein